MKFEPALPSVVKSIRQRDLLNCWLRLGTEANTLPRFADYRPNQVADELIDMMAFEVSWDGDDARFLIIHEGARLTLAYGNDYDGRDMVGTRFLDTAIGPKRYQNVIPTYQACLDHRRPVYSVSMVRDQDGKEVAYERLLLPFGEADRVDHIVGSYKTISIEGGFKVRDLMSLSADPPVTITRAVIVGQFAPPRSRPREGADDIVAV
jgi:hypothetical protein